MSQYTTEADISANGSDYLTDILRQGARDLLAAALRSEVDALLSAHGEKRDERGHKRLVRNGYLPERDLSTPLGPIKVKVPRVRDRAQGVPKIKFESKILPVYLRRSRQMETLLPWLYLKGISTGEFDEALCCLLGPSGRGVSAATICRLKEVWQLEYEDWNQRDLSEKSYVYFWADGIYFGVRGEKSDECMLVIIGVKSDGTKELVGIHQGYAESGESWKELFLKLKQQGLSSSPRLVVGDGALGLRKGLVEVFPDSAVQRCWVHKIKNVMSHLPKSKHGLSREMLKEIWNAPDAASAKKGLSKFSEMFSAKYPKAVESVIGDQEELLMFYNFPAEHWKHLRTTNPIESVFGTVRLRTAKTRGMSSRRTIGAMVFKLFESASKNFRKIDAPEKLREVMAGLKFQDGELAGDSMGQSLPKSLAA